MIRADQIPDEVVEALRHRILHNCSFSDAIAAALSAWPWAHIHEWQRPWLGGMNGTDLVLPLPTEGGDA